MEVSKLFVTMKDAGVQDETLIRSAIWNLIAEARIKREADTISLSKT
jgi:hypothetical protein